MGDLVQWEHPQNLGGIGVGSGAQQNLHYLRNSARLDQGYYDELIEVTYTLSIGTKINDFG